ALKPTTTRDIPSKYCFIVRSFVKRLAVPAPTRGPILTPSIRRILTISVLPVHIIRHAFGLAAGDPVHLLRPCVPRALPPRDGSLCGQATYFTCRRRNMAGRSTGK